MRTPPVATRSFARRLALLTALGVGVAACSSNVDNVAPASTVASTVATTSTSSTTTSSTTSTTTTSPPTTTTNPIVTTGGVVKVANSSGVNGAAGALTAELKSLGFETRKATDGQGPDGDLKVSKIYVVKGSEKVAKSISRLMGGLDILPMPTPAWITDANVGLADATVLVMLGHDLAGTKLADMAG